MLQSTAIEAQVRERLVRAYRDIAASDLDGVMTLYASDALIQSAGEPPLVGIDAIRRFWIETFASYRVELTPAIEEVHSADDVVFVRGTATGSFSARCAGERIETRVWFHQLYRRSPDGVLRFWRGANGPSAR